VHEQNRNTGSGQKQVFLDVGVSGRASTGGQLEVTPALIKLRGQLSTAPEGMSKSI
jgi:hypothetical protein